MFVLRRLLSCFLFYSFVLSLASKRILMPKIEINMLLEELSSSEAKDFMKKKSNNQTSQTDAAMNNSTSSSSEDTDESTTDLISSVVSVPPESVLPDYDGTDSNQPETPTSPPKSRPMMLSEFANHLAGGIQPRVETTTLPLPDFPTPKPSVFSSLPDDTFPNMVSEAKDFIRRYLSPEQWRKLRILLKTMKEVGGSRQDIHRAATVFISKVISKAEMAEITERKQALFEAFNRRYFQFH